MHYRDFVKPSAHAQTHEITVRLRLHNVCNNRGSRPRRMVAIPHGSRHTNKGGARADATQRDRG